MTSKKIIYLDHASTTYLDPKVKKAMDPYFESIFGNPGSLHQLGLQAKHTVQESRENIAKQLKQIYENAS